MARKSDDTMEEDSLMSLIKRLESLNKCAKLLQLQNNDVPGEINHTTNNHLQPAHCNLDILYEPLNTKVDHCSSISFNCNRKDDKVAKMGTFPINSSFGLENKNEKSTDGNVERCKPGVVIAINDRMIYDTHKSHEEQREPIRTSIYDNVTNQDMTMLSESIPNDVKFVIPDNSFSHKITLQEMKGNIKVQRQSSEEDDDDCSISSQEDIYEDHGNLQTVHHLNVPGHVEQMGNFKNNIMGSVDSGVPSSPVMRSPSVRRRRVRWHSFQKSCERESMLVNNKINTLSAGQLNRLKKISLIRLTALLERYSYSNRGGWHWTVPKILKKFKVPDYRDRNIFGVPLLTIAERTGSPLPHSILLCINYLTRVGVDRVGIFRKSGMKSRIDKLRCDMENVPDKVDFDGYSVYDVADTLKQYFRELPEPLLTTKLADTFISIHKDIPKELRLQVMQLAILLMPDENREVLQTLLIFLNEVASHSPVNQMSEKNLATCFVPAFFHLCDGATYKVDKLNPNDTPKKIEIYKSAQGCLEGMMKCVRFLFCVPDDVMMKYHFSYIEQGDPVPLEELGQNSVDPGVEEGYQGYIDGCFVGLLQETSPSCRSNNKWVLHSYLNEVEISYKKVKDGYPLRLWRGETKIHASPDEILKRIIEERHLWDDEIIQWDVLETLDETTDVFYYEIQSIAPSVKRDFVILRSWRKNINGGTCGVVMTSVQHNLAPPPSGVRGTLLAHQCYIEPIGLSSSQITYIVRIDLRGRSSRYYNKALAPRVISAAVSKIRESFNCGPDGPETKV